MVRDLTRRRSRGELEGVGRERKRTQKRGKGRRCIYKINNDKRDRRREKKGNRIAMKRILKTKKETKSRQKGKKRTI
jgi:hypothetical protein